MRRFLAGLVLMGLSTLCASAATPKRVMILNPYSRDTEPFTAAISAFRLTLGKEIQEPVAFDEVPLDLAHFTEKEGEEPLVAFLAERIRRQPVDLVVPVGGASVRFVERHRGLLFPKTPILVIAAEPRMIPPGFLEKNATLLTQRIDLPGMVEDMLQMQPNTKQIAVVFGSSALEKLWAEQCRREFQSLSSRVNFVWFDDLPFEEMLDRCANLPPRSFILHGLFLEDSMRVPIVKNEALRRLHVAANAPVFSPFASELGIGPIGGRLFQNSEIGAQAASTAVRILQGEKADEIPPRILGVAPPVYDWRELHRWHISEANLPPGSRIEFRQPGFWELYRRWIVGMVLFSSLQGALIVSLLVNRSKRLKRETEATMIADISSRFVNLPADHVDREIFDAQRRICELMNIDMSVLWQWSDRKPGSFAATHVFSLQHGPQPPIEMVDENFPWVRQEILAGRVVAHRSLDELPNTAVKDRESGLKVGIKSHLTLPLSLGGNSPIGVIGFNTLRKERSWPPALIERLKLVAEIIANALARKMADQDLRESDLRQALAVESAEAGLWELDWGSQSFWASEKARSLFGFTSGGPITLGNFEEKVHPEDLDLVRESIHQAVTAAKPIDLEYRIRPGDGGELWIASRGQPIFNSQKEPVRLVGLSMDITPGKQAEERMRQLFLTVEQSPVLVVITDLQGSIVYVNPKFSEVTGYDVAEMLGKNPRILKSGESAPSVYDDLWNTISGGKVWRGKFHNRRKNGELYWERAVISPLIDEAGKITHYVGVKEDITEQRKAGLEIQELRGELAHSGRVTLLGQLASALAHELSQPLGAILRNAEAAEILLGEPSVDLEEMRAIVTDILSDDHRAAQVIDRLRALLKRGTLELRPVELPEIITEVLSLVRGDAISRHVKIVNELPAELPRVRGDRIHLQQVLLNLLANAIDSLGGGEAGDGSVRISVRRTDSAMVEVRVSDNGPGIAPDDLNCLFEPFFTTKSTGMGMGLPISKTIIEAHEGALWAENQPEGGACFCFTIQVAEGEDPLVGLS